MKHLSLNLIGLLLITVGGCNKEQFLMEEGIAWNTVYHITYESPISLADSINLIFNEIDFSLSPFNNESTISKINGNRSSNADKHFIAVYKQSLKINRQSNGIFDPTLAPIIRAWGFGQGHEISADTLRIDSLLDIVGIQKTHLEGTKLIKDNSNIEFNFSALAKGYGVDCIADMLERNGIVNYLVEVGGEIRAAGTNPHGKVWNIGIDRPEPGAGQGEMISSVRLNNCGIATSGNYRNYHESHNKRFGHIISPLTGLPVQTDVISATVVAKTCMEADALATCCMALGSTKAIALCNRLNVGVLLILEDMSTLTNEKLADMLKE